MPTINHHQTEQRVSILTGDRLCTHCGYNLTGQSVVREPHYNLLIVRCPECSAAASVQEYPLLGRWANRWAAALAAIWFLFMIGMWIAGGAAIFGFSIGTAEIAMEEYNSRIWQNYSQFQHNFQQQNPGAAPAYQNPQLSFETWWKANGSAFMQTNFGAWTSAVNWRCLYLWIPLAIVTFVIGCFWATALLALKRHRLIIVSVAVMLVAIGFSMLVVMEWIADKSNSWYSASGRDIGVPILLLSLGFAWVVLTIGLLTGRAAVRAALRILLPPRLCHSVSILWICDGLKPPK